MIMESITLTHPASVRSLTDASWDFAVNTLWKRFPFYEGEIELYKNHIRKYYENIPPESFTETADICFIAYCIKILHLKVIDKTNLYYNLYINTMEPVFLTNLNKNEFKELLKETLAEVLNENHKALELQAGQILNVKQAAEFLHLEIATLYEKTSRKLIPHFKKGNKLYFNSSELETWILEGKVKTINELDIEATNYLLRKKRS